MKVISGLFLGFLSGLLLTFVVALSMGKQAASSSLPVAIFLVGWVISSFAFLRNTVTASKVWARGSLVGAAEWMAMIGATWLAAGNAYNQTMTEVGSKVGEHSAAASAGAGLGAGLVGVFGTGLSLSMAIVCLICWFVASRMNKEMKSEAAERPMIKCPSCAEMVFVEATKCRYCSHELKSAA